MTGQKIPSHFSEVNPEYWPRGIWHELDRPFAELKAEAETRRAGWFRSDDTPKPVATVYVRPIVSVGFVDDLIHAASAVESNLERLSRRLVIDDRPFKIVDALIGRYARSA